VARSVIRTVVTASDARNRNNGLPDEEDDYKTKLLKWIPAETVAFYTGLVGIPESLKDAYPGWYIPALVVVFLVGLFGTPLVLNRAYSITWRYKKVQLIVSTLAYVLWVLSIGTFQGFVDIPSAFMTIILACFTFLVPLFVDPGTNTSGQAP